MLTLVSTRMAWRSNHILKRPIDLFLAFGEPVKLITDSTSGKQEDLACGETETVRTPKIKLCYNS